MPKWDNLNTSEKEENPEQLLSQFDSLQSMLIELQMAMDKMMALTELFEEVEEIS